MSGPSCYLAIDLGAESGRVILGSLQDGSLELEEVHRFPNGPVNVLGTQRWDLVRLWSEILHGIRAAAKRAPQLKSVSVDSWGWITSSCVIESR
jgi:rhamnulokinase